MRPTITTFRGDQCIKKEWKNKKNMKEKIQLSKNYYLFIRLILLTINK